MSLVLAVNSPAQRARRYRPSARGGASQRDLSDKYWRGKILTPARAVRRSRRYKAGPAF